MSTVKHGLSLSESKRPTNSKIYNTLMEHHQDLLIPAKFHFVSLIAGIPKLYLFIFQIDSPLLRFTFDETSLILYRLVTLVYKKKKVHDTINLRKVMNKKFLTNQSNQLEEHLTDLWAATSNAVKNLKIAPTKKRRFRKGNKQIAVEILFKLLQHLPTNRR